MKRWKDEDFESMNWEDCYLYAVSLPFFSKSNRLCLDIDYLDQDEDKLPIKEPLIIPSLMIFDNVSNLCIDIDYKNIVDLSIYRITRTDLRPTNINGVYMRNYIIDFLNNGQIVFSATNFIQESYGQLVRGYYDNLPRELYDYKQEIESYIKKRS